MCGADNSTEISSKIYLLKNETVSCINIMQTFSSIIINGGFTVNGGYIHVIIKYRSVINVNLNENKNKSNRNKRKADIRVENG